MNVFTIIIVLIIVIIIICAIKVEYGDLCFGTSYIAGKPEIDDKKDTLFAKILTSCKHEVTSIKWRRAVVMSTIIALLSIYVLKSRLPSLREFLIIFIISYVTIYATEVFYEQSLANPAIRQINEIIEILK